MRCSVAGIQINDKYALRVLRSCSSLSLRRPLRHDPEAGGELPGGKADSSEPSLIAPNARIGGFSQCCAESDCGRALQRLPAAAAGEAALRLCRCGTLSGEMACRWSRASNVSISRLAALDYSESKRGCCAGIGELEQMLQYCSCSSP